MFNQIRKNKNNEMINKFMLLLVYNLFISLRFFDFQELDSTGMTADIMPLCGTIIVVAIKEKNV
jgi:hypothetical protein